MAIGSRFCENVPLVLEELPRQWKVTMQIVAPSRFLDGVVFAVFLLFVSGAGLFIFGEFHKTGKGPEGQSHVNMGNFTNTVCLCT
eukprot:Skav227549  [mRNA]  locus=scaffold3241:6916:7561:+ [translate_table: standard]